MINIDKYELLVKVVAIICITGLEIVALLCGIDGALLSTVFGLIGYIAGVKLPIDKWIAVSKKKRGKK